jgi:cysteine desulfurase
MLNKKKKQISNGVYLDYAATTPLDPRVFRAMAPYFSEKFGNTMSLHSWGQEAKYVLEEGREKVASLIKAKPDEIIFTGSATESNNLALKGIAFAHKKGHIIISSIEHPCIMESAKWLEGQGFKITKLRADKYGLVNPEDVRKAIKKETVLVSITHASNEIGTVQPIEKIGKICHAYRQAGHAYRQAGREKKIYFHTDAVQSFGKISIDVNKMNIDLLTASSHKMYGPKGAACLYVKKGTKIEPILHGGGQEQGLRSSTVNIPAIVGFAKACEIAKKEMLGESKRIAKLRDKLIKEVIQKIPGSYLNGSSQKRLPNIVNFWFEKVEGESMIIQLDLKGIAVSTGSACSSSKLEPSYVLLAIGLKHQQAHASLRISLGRWTKESDINYLLKVLPEIIKNLRKISGDI